MKKAKLLKNSSKWRPFIDKNKCKNCLACVSFCKQGVYEEKNKKVIIKNPFKCIDGCRGCERICPNYAISHTFEDNVNKNQTNFTCCNLDSNNKKIKYATNQ